MEAYSRDKVRYQSLYQSPRHSKNHSQNHEPNPLLHQFANTVGSPSHKKTLQIRFKCTRTSGDGPLKRGTGYTCTETDKGCSPLHHFERQRLHEAQEIATREAAGQETIRDATPLPQSRIKSIVPTERISDRFRNAKCRHAGSKADDLEGCQGYFRTGNEAAECEYGGCEMKTSSCGNCRFGRGERGDLARGFVVSRREGGGDLWVCCEKCRLGAEEGDAF